MESTRPRRHPAVASSGSQLSLLNALRYGDWKITFGQIEGNLFTGRRVTTDVPIVTNLRPDPFECFLVDSGM